MAKHHTQLENGASNLSSTIWESQGIMIQVHKTLDSTEPPITIDLAATLGASSGLPLAVKKAVRYWFKPEVRTKADVVRCINTECRRNGFKISTVSNSKQGLDRRAQLVCSRGIVARKPRGKTKSVNTMTTRPVSAEEKCPFSVTVYECRKSGRWYIRKFGNGSKMHCGHCQLIPDQVGIRQYQNLTERSGLGWCESTRSSPENQEGDIEPDVCILANDTKSPYMDLENTLVDAAKQTNTPTETQTNSMLGLPSNNSLKQMQQQQQHQQKQQQHQQQHQQLLRYITSLRQRILYRDYTDRLIMERLRRLKGIKAGLNGSGSQNTLVKNLISDSDRSLLKQMNGRIIMSDRIQNYADLLQRSGMHQIPNVTSDDGSPNVDPRSSNVERSPNLDESIFERQPNTESKSDGYQSNEGKKRPRNDTPNDAGNLQHSIPKKDCCRSETGNGCNVVRTDVPHNKITKKRSVSNEKTVPDPIGSYAHASRKGKVGGQASDHSQALRVVPDYTASNQFSGNVDVFDDLAEEYATLRPMAIQDYPDGQT